LTFVSSNKARNGFSLTEMAIVLGILGIVLGALWGAVSIVRENIRRSEAKEQMMTIVSKIRDHYMGRACASVNFSCATANADLTDSLMQQGVLLAEQYRKGTNPALADHPWGSNGGGASLIVRAVDDGRDQFSLELNSLPQDSCIAMATALSGVGAPPGIEAVNINGVAAALPVTVADAQAACVNAGAANTLLLTYRLRP